MSDSFPFSKERLLALPLPDSGRSVYLDAKVRGLQIRVTPSGTKTFCVYRRLKRGQPERVTLGRFPTMTVEQARKAALAVMAEIEAGGNPAAVRRAVRAEPSFADAFEEFLDGKRKRDGSPLADKTKRSYRDVVRLYLSAIQNKKLSDITRDDVKAAQRKAARKSQSQACQAAAVVSAVFSHVIDQEVYGGPNPASRVQKAPPPSRDRFAQATELPYLLAAIAESEQRDFFLLALLTGARRSNLQEMLWRDVDLDAGLWRIGKTKNGTPQNIPLTPEAVMLLKARVDVRKACSGSEPMSPYVFPGTGKTGHLVEPKKAWATILGKASMRRLLDTLAARQCIDDQDRDRVERLLDTAPVKAERELLARVEEGGIDPADYDMTDLRIHDLRRTLGSWQARTGSSLAIIGKSLNHKTHQATQIYARLDLDPVRQSVSTATAAMFEAAGMKDAAGVVKLRSGRGAT